MIEMSDPDAANRTINNLNGLVVSGNEVILLRANTRDFSENCWNLSPILPRPILRPKED